VLHGGGGVERRPLEALGREASLAALLVFDVAAEVGAPEEAAVDRGLVEDEGVLLVVAGVTAASEASAKEG
jgi:hypothetical protein